MEFSPDRERQGRWWVDSGIDGKVDAFEPCEMCDSILDVKAQEETVWQEHNLCGPCETDFEFKSAMAELFGERPYNLDRDIDSISPSHGVLE